MTTLRYDADGLVPGIVQHAITGQVLMLGYLNEESLRQSHETSLVTFWSRSRGALWQKGETSDNTLSVVSVTADCDGDALLIKAVPAGPTCHTGQVTCFDDADREGFAWLEELWQRIANRVADQPEGSYTTRLVSGGVDAVGRKVTEEGVRFRSQHVVRRIR